MFATQRLLKRSELAPRSLPRSVLGTIEVPFARRPVKVMSSPVVSPRVTAPLVVSAPVIAVVPPLGARVRFPPEETVNAV